MAVILWPPELPQSLLRDGFSESLPDGRLRSPMAGGPPKVRRKFSAAIVPVTAQIFATYSQRWRFDRFWREDTRGGSLPFVIRNQTLDGLALATESGALVTTELGETILITAYWLAQFGEAAPRVEPFGVRWTISFPLEVLP